MTDKPRPIKTAPIPARYTWEQWLALSLDEQKAVMVAEHERVVRWQHEQGLPRKKAE